MSFFPSLCFCFLTQQVVDIIETVHKAVFFVCIDFEVFVASGSFIRNGLLGQVYFHFGFGIGRNRVEQFFEKRFAYDNREYEIVEFVVFVNIGKKTRYDNPKSVIGDGPSGVFPARSGTEIFTGYQYFTSVGRVIEYEIFIYGTVGIVTPVPKKIFTEPLSGSSFEKACQYDLYHKYN